MRYELRLYSEERKSWDSYCARHFSSHKDAISAGIPHLKAFGGTYDLINVSPLNEERLRASEEAGARMKPTLLIAREMIQLYE